MLMIIQRYTDPTWVSVEGKTPEGDISKKPKKTTQIWNMLLFNLFFYVVF